MSRGLVIVCLLFSADVASAAQITGNLREGDRAVGAGIAVVVKCDADTYPGNTDAFGSYSIFVPHEGKCVLTVEYQGHTTGGFEIYSYPDPAKYDFDLVRAGDGTYSLTRR